MAAAVIIGAMSDIDPPASSMFHREIAFKLVTSDSANISN